MILHRSGVMNMTALISFCQGPTFTGSARMFSGSYGYGMQHFSATVWGTLYIQSIWILYSVR